MDQHIAYLGQWGLPGSELAWPGRFAYEPGNGVEVEIIAPDEMLPFEGAGPVHTQPVSHYPVVHGRTLTAYVTLVDAQVSLRGHFPGGYEARLRPRRAFVGCAYDPDETISFKRFHVGIDGLENWSNARGGTYKYFFEPKRFELTYSTPAPIRLGANSDIDIRIVLGTSSAGPPKRVHKFTFEQGAYLELTSAQPQLYEAYDDLARRVRDFLSFVTGRGMHIRWQTGYIDPGPPPAKQFPHPVHAFAQGTAEPPNLGSRSTDRLEPDEMLFTADRTISSPAARLERWLTLCETSRDVLNLYLADRYNPTLPLEFKFLTIVQAVESFHARRFDTRRLPTERHTRNVEAVVAAAPKRLQEFAQVRLLGQNRRAFRDCIVDVIERLPPAARDEFRDASDFAKRVSIARNRYTHWNPGLAATAAQGGELYGLTFALRAVLDALLLRELGFSKRNVDRLLHAHADFKGDLRYALGLLEP